MARRDSPAVPWLLLSGLLLTWVLWYPPSPDLAAQVYRVHLFATDGFSLWDNGWYGGHYLPSYSLIVPAFASFFGLRFTGVLAVTCSTLIFRRIVGDARAIRVPTATALFALSAAGDLYIGRVAFACGVTCGLASALSLMRGFRIRSGAFSLACAAASPVAAAFLVLVACGELLAHRAPARAAVLAGPALALSSAIFILFPEGGYEPFALTSLLGAAGATAVVLLFTAPRHRFVRRTGALYLLALVFAYVLRSPMGSNAVRFGVLFAPAALAAYVSLEDVRRALDRLDPRMRPTTRIALVPGARLGRALAVWVLLATSMALVAWQVAGPLSQSIRASDNSASRPAFYLPAIRYLQTQARGRPLRVEVVFTSSHWDAAILGRHFLLARGWERQTDTSFNSLFYEPHLDDAEYHAWLLENGVAFVALPNAPLDFSSVREGALVRRQPAFLHLVMHSANWKIYRVLGARALASGPGSLVSLDGDGFSLRVARPGTFIVRVHDTRYWRITSGSGTVGGALGWTRVIATRAGELSVDAEFPLAL